MLKTLIANHYTQKPIKSAFELNNKPRTKTDEQRNTPAILPGTLKAQLTALNEFYEINIKTIFTTGINYSSYTFTKQGVHVRSLTIEI